jgi:hypothetical protein
MSSTPAEMELTAAANGKHANCFRFCVCIYVLDGGSVWYLFVPNNAKEFINIIKKRGRKRILRIKMKKLKWNQV